MNEQRVPSDRLSRLMGVARVGAASGLGLLGSARASASAATTLRRMRGLAAKAGQMMSYVDGMLPPEAGAQLRANMERLRASTLASRFDAIEATLEQELGENRRDIVEIERNPFASASIGQVHRGRLRDGSVVAIKIQHPGVAAALEADLANVALLERLMRAMGGDALDPKRLIEELADRFREELDYRLEAQRMVQFHRLHRANDRVVVPRVHQQVSTRRVLVSDMIVGASFEQACAAPEEHRVAWAETMWGFVHSSILVGGLFNADPHPGNFIFLEDGRVACIDFGCVQTIPEARREIAARMHRAAVSQDREAMNAAARQLLGTRGGRYEKRALAYIERALRPLWDAPFRIDRAYVTCLVQEVKDMMAELRATRFETYVPMQPGTLFMNRLQFGFYSVLAGFDVEVDYAAVERRHIHHGSCDDVRRAS